MHPIIFPNLGIEIAINPIAFNIFNKNIYWYGIIITAGIIISMILGKKDSGKYGLKWETVLDYLLITFIPALIGARIYYVMFRWDHYKENLSQIIEIWNGGIAIYGAIITAIAIAFAYCKKKKISFLNLCDYCVPYLALAQSIGRWGNFVNQEAYGEMTNTFFKMGIYDSIKEMYIYVHPTFLYEAIGTFTIFICLYLYRNKRKYEGEIFYYYMFGYGIVRSLVEGLRTDSLYAGAYRISQILAIVFVTIALILIIINVRKEKNSKENKKEPKK